MVFSYNIFGNPDHLSDPLVVVVFLLQLLHEGLRLLLSHLDEHKHHHIHYFHKTTNPHQCNNATAPTIIFSHYIFIVFSHTSRKKFLTKATMQPPHPAPVSLAPKAPLSLDKETKVSRPVEEHWDKKDDDGDDKDGDDDDGDDVDGDDEDDESDLIMIFAGGMAGRHEVAQGGQS